MFTATTTRTTLIVRKKALNVARPVMDEEYFFIEAGGVSKLLFLFESRPRLDANFCNARHCGTGEQARRGAARPNLAEM
jgi:hypothetical protein